MVKKIKDLRVIDRKKADEISDKIKEIRELLTDISSNIDHFTSKGENNEPSSLVLFIVSYMLSNPNVLVSDFINALNNNGKDSNWVTHNPNQILDIETIASLIICANKFGETNVKDV